MSDPNQPTVDFHGGKNPIDTICGQFKAQWLSGKRPTIEQFVKESLGDVQSVLLKELIGAEIAVRREHGEQCGRDDFISRFPDSAEVIDALFDETIVIEAQRADDGTTPGAVSLDSTVVVAKSPVADASPSKSRFGDYELLEEIARGGMGVVYKARQTKANRIVALKMILSGNLADEEEVRRFYTEAEAAANLDHPNIVPVYDVGEINGQHFFSMGFVDGPSLASLVREGPLEPRSAAELVKTVAEAIEYAHQQKTIHRDLKPANILLQGDDAGVPRVTDFGLAKRVADESDLTVSGQIMGTPSYMPPEQALGKIEEIGALSDVYSLGAVLYHLLTGRPPFRAASMMETLSQVVEQEPVSPRNLNPAIDLDLDTIVLKSLQKDPSRRYSSAQDLAADLARFLDHRPIRARRVSAGERVLRWARRNKVVTALLTMLFVGMIGVTIASLVAASVYSDMANTQRGLKETADEKTKDAEKAQDATRESYYVAQMNNGVRVAQSASGADLLRDLVDEWIPDADEEDLRGWEWYWLASVAARADFTIQTFPVGGNGSTVSSVDWSSDGTTIAWAASSEVRVAKVDPLEVVATFYGDESKLIFCVRFSPDGLRVAAAGHDRTVRVWDIKTQKTLIEMKLQSAIGAVCWHPNNRIVAFQTNFASDASIHIVDIEKQEEIETLDVEIDGHLRSIEFSPDGKWFASAGFIPLTDHSVKVWNAQTWDLLGNQHVHRLQVYGVAWDASSRRVASVSMDGSAKVWNIESGDVTTLKESGPGLGCVAWSPGGRQIAVGGRDFAARILDANDGTEMDVLRAHTAPVNSVRWSPDGMSIATTGDDGMIRLWDMSRAPPVRSLKQNKTSVVHKGAHVFWNPTGDRVAAANNQPFTIWDAESGKPHLLHVAPDNGIGYTQLGGRPIWSADGKFMSSSYRNVTTIWNGAGDQTVRTIQLQPGLNEHAFSPIQGDQRLAFSLNPPEGKSSIWICDLAQDGELVEVVSDLGTISAMAWRPDGRQVGVVTDQQQIVICDLNNGERVRTFDAGKIASCIAWSPDGSQLVLGHKDHTATVWKCATGSKVMTLDGHTFTVNSVAWNPDGQRIATGSGDQTVRIWNAKSGKTMIVFSHDDEVKSIAWSPDGHQLATMSQDAIMKIWDASRGFELERAENQPD